MACSRFSGAGYPASLAKQSSSFSEILYQKYSGVAGGMAEWLKALAAFEEDLGSDSKTHMEALNYLKLQF